MDGSDSKVPRPGLSIAAAHGDVAEWHFFVKRPLRLCPAATEGGLERK